VHRDVRADAVGLSGLRLAVAAMTASAVPYRPGAAARSLEPPASPPGELPALQHGVDGAADLSQSPVSQSSVSQSPASQSSPSAAAEHNGQSRSRTPRQRNADHNGYDERGHDAESRRMLALVELAQDGDGEAFGQLYDAYSDTVYRYIYYRVSNKPLAEDLTSETFLRALRRIGTFTWQGRDFGAWLVTIARNLVADHFKSSRYRLEVPTGEMLDSDDTVASPEDSVLSYLSNKALLDAVCQLNSQQQECVTLRFLHGLSVAETAKIMGKNDGAIKTLQYRAIRTLARLLPVESLR
jgi:RNA polymerase sigma-70 factor (ECF subfamily)